MTARDLAREWLEAELGDCALVPRDIRARRLATLTALLDRVAAPARARLDAAERVVEAARALEAAVLYEAGAREKMHAPRAVLAASLDALDAAAPARAGDKVLLAQLDRAEALLRFGLDCNFFECPNNPPCDDPEDGFAVDHYCDACKLVHDATVLFGWTEDE